MAQMTVERLHELLEKQPKGRGLRWEGRCHDCSGEMAVTATPLTDGIHIEGGGVYETEPEKFLLKCDACFQEDRVLRNFQNCEVYSRVVGYLRPVVQWNDAKQAEFRDRALYDGSLR